ncbi:DUF4229 domain-containing protein [Rhodococcus chondri]|uniref:DUF4229 domain-containing protein n=1 Tax=Rhodococcus chondri TaxID=3065941 RepID=UPI0038B451BA
MNDEHPNASSDNRSDRSRNTPPRDPARAGSAKAAPDSGKSSLARDVALYSLARLALVVVLAVVIIFVPRLFGVDIPLLIAALFAVLIALPLSLVLFAPLRRRVNEGIATVDERRRAARADLEGRLRGEDGK